MGRLGGFVTVALAWNQVRPGEWEEYQIRQCPCCSTFRVQQLHYVNPKYFVCLSCLSQRVRPAEGRGRPAIICVDCGIITELDTDADPALEDGESQYGEGPEDEDEDED